MVGDSTPVEKLCASRQIGSHEFPPKVRGEHFKKYIWVGNHLFEDSWRQEYPLFGFHKIHTSFPQSKGPPSFQVCRYVSWSHVANWKFSTLRSQMVGNLMLILLVKKTLVLLYKKKHQQNKSTIHWTVQHCWTPPQQKTTHTGSDERLVHLQPWVPWKERNSWSEPKLHEDMFQPLIFRGVWIQSPMSGLLNFTPNDASLVRRPLFFFCYQNLGFSMPKKRHLTWSNATCCNRDDVILLVKNHTDSVLFLFLLTQSTPFQRKYLTM